MFGCLTKLGAKRAELVQKFVPRSPVGIFRNKCTQSTTLDHKLMFWCILYYLGAFGIVWLPYETRCKTGRSSAKVCATKSRHNFSQRTHPMVRNAPKHEFRVPWGGSGAFVAENSDARGTNFCTSSERFAPSFVRQLNGPKCTQMVRNTPKHEFRVQWVGSGAFVAKNSDTTSWHEHFATKAPDPPHWTLNSCFGAFRTIGCVR